MNKDFCILIITHKRPDNVITYNTLKKCGNKYPVYLVIDNTDTTANRYIELYGKKNVIVFNKLEYAEKTDQGDNFNDLRTTTHARNACFDIAKNLGYTYFLVLDDDYTAFSYMFDSDNNFKQKGIKNINNIIGIFLKYYKNISAKSICFLQRGDLIGGGQNTALISNKYPFQKRKAMNSWFCSVDRPFKFISRLNEDVNTYMTLGTKGDIFMSIPLITLNQKQTQSNAGGMSESYLDSGTYIKSFYTVMYCPSFTKAEYQINMGRIHHKITWNNAVPKILDEKFKKV